MKHAEMSCRTGKAFLLTVATLIAGGLITARTAFSAERPNIILCMGDDHGFEETGYNGHPYLKTPVLDEMAAQGLRLDRFHSGHPSCSPTRGSVLTGRHPNRYGTFTPGCSIRPEEITIAHLLGKAGYACGHFGKWHLGPVKASSPTNPGAMGFDYWVSHDNFFELNPQLSRNGGPPVPYEGESSAIVIDETIKFIQQTQQQKKPFLAVVWFGSPHEPYSGLPDDLALYDDLPEKYLEKTVRLTSNETGQQIRRPLRDVLRERFAEITAMDRAIGTLRTFLAEQQLRDNTILWYCGDNGIPPSGLAESQFRGLKGTLYEGGTRVPGIIEWPARITAPRSSAVNSVTSDMLPTICSIAGVPLPKRDLDGIDLTPLLNGTMRERPRPICFWEYNMRREVSLNLEPYIDPELQKGTTPLAKLMGGVATRNFRNYRHPTVVDDDYSGTRTIVGNQYKLMLRTTQDGEQKQLFDLQEDPAESENVLGEYPKVAAQMEAELTLWQESVLNSLMGAEYR